MNFDNLDDANFTQQRFESKSQDKDYLYKVYVGSLIFNTRKGPVFLSTRVSYMYRDNELYGLRFGTKGSPYEFLMRLIRADKAGSVSAIKPNESVKKIYGKVVVEASFPGGDQRWNQYILRVVENNYDDLNDAGEAGTCEVQFTIDEGGNVSNVQALNMKGTLFAKIIVEAIEKGPKWIPAIQDGHNVKSWRRQQVKLRLRE